MSEHDDADGENAKDPSILSEETTLQKVNLQEIFDRVGRVITPDDYAYPFDLRCKDLSEVERNTKRQTEQALYGLHSAGKREAGMLGPLSAKHKDHADFVARFNAYNSDGGLQPFLFFIPYKLRFTWLGKLKAIHGKHQPITTWSSTDQRYLHEAIYSFYQQGRLGEAATILDKFKENTMPVSEYFDPDSLDTYLGNYIQISEDNLTQFNNLSVKDKNRTLYAGIQPSILKEPLIAQANSCQSQDDAFTAIHELCVPFHGWLTIEKKYGRTYPGGRKTEPTKKGAAKTPALQSYTTEEWKALPAQARDAHIALQRQTREADKKAKAINEVTLSAGKCGNCGNQGKTHLALPQCDVACRAAACKDHPRHFVDQCKSMKAAVKKAMQLQLAVDDASEVCNNLKIRNISTSETIMKISSSSSGRKRRIEKLAIIYDAGASTTVSPIPIDNSTVQPLHDTLSTATKESTDITGKQLIGTQNVYIVPKLHDVLVNQDFIDAGNNSTLLMDHHLHILNSTGTDKLRDLVSCLQNENGILYSTPQAPDNLYHLDLTTLYKLRDTHKTNSGLRSDVTANIARYHTVQFANLKDLVLYWHIIFRHAPMDEMIRIVKNSVIKNLPAQLTVETIRKHFPALPFNPPCLDCALGSIPLKTSPPAHDDTPVLLDASKKHHRKSKALPVPPIDDAIATVISELLTMPNYDDQSNSLLTQLHQFRQQISNPRTHVPLLPIQPVPQLSQDPMTQPVRATIPKSRVPPLHAIQPEFIVTQQQHRVGIPTIQQRDNSIQWSSCASFIGPLQPVIPFWQSIDFLSSIKQQSQARSASAVRLDNLAIEFDESTVSYRGLSPYAIYKTDIPRIPRVIEEVGHHWQADFKKFSGDDLNPVTSIGGYTHTFAAIDKISGRVIGMPTRGVSQCVQYFLHVYDMNKRLGYTMKTFAIDKGMHNKLMIAACKERNVRLTVAIPDEHWGIGSIERWHRNIHEGILKKTLTNPNISDDMWCYGFRDDLDMYNALLTSRHPTQSPYQLYDRITIDAASSPLLHYGSIVVAQIPTKDQTFQTGRGIELIVIGRYADGYEGIQLFNPITRRSIVRRSFKVMGDHPVKGFAFTTPIQLEEDLTQMEYDDLTSTLTPSAPMPTQDIIAPDIDLPDYSPPLKKSDLHASQKKFFSNVGLSFTDTDMGDITSVWTIDSIVRNKRQLFYKYFDMSQPKPTHDSAFEYTPCKELCESTWANFIKGHKIANILKLNIDQKIPTSYEALMRMTDLTMRQHFLNALKSECDSYHENKVVGEMPDDFDWTSINPSEMGDLMLLFSVKYNADGTLDKYKCRIVFRGDRWKNINHLSTYSSSMEEDATKLLIATAASENLDMFSADVKTAFLHGMFPPGMVQYVRAPRGLPIDLLPRKFRLDRCGYGHPLAGVQWEEHSTNTLVRLGCKQLVSSKSVFKLNKDGETLILGRVTDDLLIVCRNGSPLKEWFLSELAKTYTITKRDPLESFVGLHITRNFDKHTATLTQPKHINSMESKYLLKEGGHYPSTPMLPSSVVLSAADILLKAQPLSAKQILELQSVLGDISWVVHKTRPDALFAYNMISRQVPHATALDMKHAIRIAHYIIGTKHLGLTVGGKHGARIIACVDTSYAIHDDFKSHSSWSIHISDGGAVIARTKKQSIMTDSSTLSELVGAHLSIKDIMWCRYFLQEIGYPQRSATTLFIDNQSTLKIIHNKCNSGKTRHIDIRYNLIRELVAAKEIRCAYLPTDRMIPDMGTKHLAAGPFKFLRNYILGSSTLKEFQDTLSSTI